MHLPIPDRLAHRLLDHPRVTALARGVDADGRMIVTVGVARPCDLHAVEQDPDIPDRAGDVRLVCEVMGEPKSLAELEPVPLENHRKTRTRPVPIGYSAGHAQVTAGTSSWLLTDGSQVFMASNRHVYAPGDASLGDPIIQPGRIHGGSAPDDTVAKLSGFVEPHDGYRADLAWGRPLDIDVPENHIENVGIPAPSTMTPEVGMPIWKSGAMSGITTGEVKHVDIVFDNVGGARMERQFSTSAFSTGGDSGSPFYVREGGDNHPVGMLWGAFVTENGGFIGSIGSTVGSIQAHSNMEVKATPVGDVTSGEGGIGGRELVLLGGMAAIALSQR